MISDLCTIPSYLTLATTAFLGCSAIAMLNFASKNKRIQELKEATSTMWFCLFSTGLAIGSLIGFYYERSLNNNDPKNISNIETLHAILGSLAFVSNLVVGTALFSRGGLIVRDMFSSSKKKQIESDSDSMALDSSRSV